MNMQRLGVSLVLLLLLSTGATGICRPHNAVAIDGRQVNLHCSTPVDRSCIWVAARSAGDVVLTIYDGSSGKLQVMVSFYVLVVFKNSFAS